MLFLLGQLKNHRKTLNLPLDVNTGEVLAEIVAEAPLKRVKAREMGSLGTSQR